MLYTGDCVQAAETLANLAYKGQLLALRYLANLLMDTLDEARANIYTEGGIGILAEMLNEDNSRSACLVLRALMKHSKSWI